MSAAEARQTPTAPARGPMGLACALLALVLLAAFFPVAAGRRTFFHLDLLYEHLPVWDATQKMLLAGDPPFWLDGEYCGHPVLFHQEAPLFYPPTVPLLRTGAPVHRLADAFTLFHLWLAGLAAFLLVRDLTGSSRAALFGGIAWMLSARMVQSAIWPNAVAVSALLPLLVLGIWRIGGGRRRSGILWVSVTGGLALLAARPHVLLAASPLLASVTVAAVLASRHRVRAIGDLALASLLALAVGAPSLVPSAALYPETSRARGLSREEREFQPLRSGENLDMVFFPVDGAPRWPEAAAYAGIVTCALFLAGCVLAARRRGVFPRTFFFALAFGGAVGLLFAFGEKGPYGIVANLPLVRGFRVPARYLLCWSFALAIGSALALAAWLDRARRPNRIAACLVALLAADLVWHARRAAPTAPSGVYEVEPELTAAMRPRLAPDAGGFPGRFAPLTETRQPLGLSDALTLDRMRTGVSLKGALGMRFGLESAYGAGPTLARTEALLARPTRRALELAGVRCIVLEPPRDPAAARDDFAPPVIQDFESLPRAILVPEAMVVPHDLGVRVTLSAALDPRRTAVLEEGEPRAKDSAWVDADARVRLISRAPSRITLEARLPAPGVLVIFDSYESGWRAAVDGVSAAVERADGAFQGIRLPGGAHRIELSYAPPGLREGLGLGLAGVLGIVLAAAHLRPRANAPTAGTAPRF